MRRRRPRQRPRNVPRLPAATSAAPAARSSPPTASSLARSVPSDDDVQVPARATRKRPRNCSRTSSATSRSTSARPASRARVHDELAGRDIDARASTTSATCSRTRQTTGTVVLTLSNVKRSSSRPPTRSRRSGARWSCSTCSTGAVVAMYSNPTYRPQPARVSHDTEAAQAASRRS